MLYSFLSIASVWVMSCSSILTVYVPFSTSSLNTGVLCLDDEIVIPPSKILKLGKLRGAVLPVEYDLLRLIENITNPHNSWMGDTPACEWMGVVCNEKLQVTKIEWGLMKLQGTIIWSALPNSLRDLSLLNNQLTGHVDLTHLPEGLNELWIMQNYFSGSVDLTCLSCGLNKLFMSNNEFVGSVDLTQLPDSLMSLSLSRNHLTGSIDLMCLPHEMKYLYLNNNELSGIADLTLLPKNMVRLDLSKNCFVQFISETIPYNVIV